MIKNRLNKMNIVNKIKKYVEKEFIIHKNKSEDGYDFWNEHIKYVYEKAVFLAKKYNADVEIVSIGALMHDIALIKKVEERPNHHINGAKITENILKEYGYPQEKIEKVKSCVLHHRTSFDAVTNEEVCVADADILSHFDNIPMIFDYAYKNYDVNLSNIRSFIKRYFENDYNDLSDKTKTIFKEEYENIMGVLFK